VERAAAHIFAVLRSLPAFWLISTAETTKISPAFYK
jgi:hypothetical protein